MGISFILKKGGQGQVTKGHEKQRSHLSSVTHVVGAILPIQIDGGIRSIQGCARLMSRESNLSSQSRVGRENQRYESSQSRVTLIVI